MSLVTFGTFSMTWGYGQRASGTFSMICIELYGLHPKCWSIESIKKIGEKWGPVLWVEQVGNGVQSLTFARLLVRTKAQNKIDTLIRLEWESGNCDVWVKESNNCSCKFVCSKQQVFDSQVNIDDSVGVESVTFFEP